MSESKPIPVRLSPEIIQRIDHAINQMGITSRTAVIKFCLSSFLDYFEKNGMAGLPLNWKEIIHDLNGRSQRYKEKKGGQEKRGKGLRK